MANSVPIEILHEAEGSMVAVEMKKGDIYRGNLDSAEDSMNCHLSNVTHKAKDGKISKMEQVYVRGSHVKLFVLPDMLVNAPALAKVAKAVAAKAEADATKRGLGGKARGAAAAGTGGGRNVFS